jgi:hypothetical protein
MVRQDNLDVAGRIILKRILEVKNGVICTTLIWLRIVASGGCLMNMAINLRGP